MTRTLALVALAAALAGCERETIVAGEPYDPQANAVQNLQNVQLPPAIVASHTYRCRDNSLVYVDWFNNDTARVKRDQAEAGVTLAKGEDAAFSGENQRLTGAPAEPTITLNGLSCRR
jgi:hypothetical protein